MSITEIKIDTPTEAEAAALAALTTTPKPDYEALYNEKTAEVERLQTVLTAGRLAANRPDNRSSKPQITAERVKALVGNAGLLKMSRAEKLASIGVDPNSVTDELLRRIFGRGADGAVGQDLMKSDPARYGLLKQAAIILNIYGN